MAKAAWSEFQEAVKKVLNQQRGVCAETNKRIPGTRTHHDIDVYAKFTALGAPITWLIECKLWAITCVTVKGKGPSFSQNR